MKPFSIKGVTGILFCCFSFLAAGGSSIFAQEEVPAPTILSPSVEQKKPLSGSLACITSPKAPIRSRLVAVRNLGDDLNAEEIETVFAFLKTVPRVEESNLAGLNVLKNNLLNVLQDQTTGCWGLTELTIAIYQDQKQPEVLRNYALQHLASGYELGLISTPEAREKIQMILFASVQAMDNFAGTALLGLHRIAMIDSAVSGEKVKSTVLRLLRAPVAKPEARVVAVQICADRGIKDALNDIQTWSQFSTDVPLRVSAISALGKLGGASEAVILQKIKNESVYALQPAVEVALQSLTKKNHQPL